jgi:uncharacterized small protein (DUF1192 family)
LPGQFALALVNATAILVIVAAVLAMVAFSRVENLSETVAATATDAVLSRVDVDPQKALADLQDLRTDIRGLTAALEGADPGNLALSDAQVERLNARLGALQDNIQRLYDGRKLLVDEALARIGRSLAQGLEQFGNCTRPATGEPAPV